MKASNVAYLFRWIVTEGSWRGVCSLFYFGWASWRWPVITTSENTIELSKWTVRNSQFAARNLRTFYSSGTSIEYHFRGRVGPGHTMHEPNDIDRDEYGQKRSPADNISGSDFQLSTGSEQRLIVSAAGGAAVATRLVEDRFPFVLVVPLITRKNDIFGARHRRWLVSSLGQLDVEKIGEVRQREVFQR